MSKKKDSFKPWLSRPAINRSVTIPFTTSLTHRLSSLGEFHPNDLDPFLLFDARDSMIGTLENPTLDLDPSKPDTLNVITATRAGVATFTDANGNIATAPANTVRVDQTQGAELTPTVFQHFSQTDFSNSYWSKRDATITSGFSSPDGGNNAFKLVASQSDGDVFASAASGNSHTKVVSVFAKANSATSKLRIQEQNYTGKRTEFDLNLGTITYSNSSGTSTIENIGDGWYRCAHVETYSSGQGTVAFAFRSVTADSLFLFGPQVEEGTTATTFVPNTTGSPKFITGPTFGPRVPMILVEPSATNLVDNSTSFQTTGSVVKELGIDAPDGTNTATRISNIAGAPGTDAVYSLANSISPSSQIVGSLYLKGEAGKVVRLYLKRYNVGGYVATNSSSVILTGDWQRYESPSLTLGSDNTNAAVTIRNDALVTADSVDVWGGQIESGSVATSLIPTAGGNAAARTRAADDLVISGSAFSDFYNASEGTFYAEVIDRIPSENAGYLTGQSLNQAFLYSNINLAVDSFDGVNFQRVSGVVAKELFRAAATYNSNTKTMSFNGTTLADGAHNGNWATTNILNIGWSGSSVPTYGQFNGHIKRVIYWPYHSDSL